MTELRVAKNLLSDANDRIFDLECALAERNEDYDYLKNDANTHIHRLECTLATRANEIDDLKDQIDRLRARPRQIRKLSRKQREQPRANSRRVEKEFVPSSRAKKSKLSFWEYNLDPWHQAEMSPDRIERQPRDPLHGLPIMSPRRQQSRSPSRASPTCSQWSPQRHRTASPSPVLPTSPAWTPIRQQSSSPSQTSPTSPAYTASFPDSDSYEASFNRSLPRGTSPAYSPSPAWTPNSPQYVPHSPISRDWGTSPPYRPDSREGDSTEQVMDFLASPPHDPYTS